jgi:hypothetical protein
VRLGRDEISPDDAANVSRYAIGGRPTDGGLGLDPRGLADEHLNGRLAM